MSQSSHRTAIALAALAGLGAFAAPAVAQALNVQRIVIDSTTGRVATPDGAAAAASVPAATGAPARQRAAMLPAHIAPMLSSSRPVAAQLGARGFRPEAGRLSYSVVQRNADGSLTTQCVTGETAALQALHGGAPQGNDHAAH